MRIVGGRFRGRALAAPKSQAIRPTSDRLREALFNILVHAYGDPITGARVLDLFAGTGALGLEALSRGAAFALFVDDGAEARALLREQRRDARASAARARSSAATPPNSAPRLRSRRFRWPFSIRPTAGDWLRRRSPLRAKAAGSRRMRSPWSRRRRMRRSRRPTGFTELERRDYDDTRFVFLRVV